MLALLERECNDPAFIFTAANRLYRPSSHSMIAETGLDSSKRFALQP